MKWTSWQNLQKSLNNYGFKLADKAWRDGYSRWQGPDAFHKNSTRQELESIKRLPNSGGDMDIFVPLFKTPTENDESESELLASFGESDEYRRLLY